MAKLNDLVNRFEALVAAQDGIKTFVFDDLSAINQVHDAEYPKVMLEPPTGFFGAIVGPTTVTLRANRSVPTPLTFNLFLLDLYQQDEQKTKTLQQKFSDLLDEMATLIKSVENDNNDFILGEAPIPINMDHLAHNDQLIFVQATVTFTLKECY